MSGTPVTGRGVGRLTMREWKCLFPRQGNLVSVGRFERSPCHAFICNVHSHLPIQFWVGSDLFRIYIHETRKPIKTAVGHVCPANNGSQLEAGDSPARTVRAEA